MKKSLIILLLSFSLNSFSQTAIIFQPQRVVHSEKDQYSKKTVYENPEMFSLIFYGDSSKIILPDQTIEGLKEPVLIDDPILKFSILKFSRTDGFYSQSVSITFDENSNLRNDLFETLQPLVRIKERNFYVEKTNFGYLIIHFKNEINNELIYFLKKCEGVESCSQGNRYSINIFFGKMFEGQAVQRVNRYLKEYDSK